MLETLHSDHSMTTSEPRPDAPSSFRYTLERTPGSMVTVRVEIDAERLRAQTDRVFTRRVRDARIPGFRPGKAPRAMYERRYGAEHLWHEAAEDLVDETYREIVRREDLAPLDQPKVTLGAVAADAPVTYTAEVPVRPPVTLGDYGAHGVSVEPKAITDEDVERTIAGLREGHAELRPVDREARIGDVLTVDVDVTLEGKQLPPIGRNAHLELGREYAIPGLAEGLVGARAADERRLDLTFPDDHPDTDVRGKTGSFVVKVSAVAEKILPDLDDSFAKTVGVESIAALRKAVRSELAHGSFHEARDDAAEKLMEHVLATSTVEVPQVLVHDELDHMVAELKERVRRQGLTYEQFLLQARTTEEKIRDEWHEAAARRARSLLVLDALARTEGVTVSGEELAGEVAGTPIAQDPRALRDPAVLAALARSLRNRKVVDKLIGLGEPNAERDAIKKAGGGEDEPALIVPEAHPEQTAESREAIRDLLTKR
jgi:trigger factor